MKQRKRSRRGVSLVETVVAMTVVVIVSIAALTAISASMNVNARDEASFQARVDARNALELFRAGALTVENLSQFKPVTTPADGVFTVDYGRCTLTVSTNGNTFSARAVDSTGKVLFKVENYEKK